MGCAEATDEVFGDAVCVAEVESVPEESALTRAWFLDDDAPRAGVRLDHQQAAPGRQRPALADFDPAQLRAFAEQVNLLGDKRRLLRRRSGYGVLALERFRDRSILQRSRAAEAEQLRGVRSHRPGR